MGASIEGAADSTCIPRRYLEALERDAPIEEYPAPAFARHFLREYARFLGLDEGSLLAGLGVPEPGSELPHGEPIQDEPPPRRRRVAAVVLTVAVLAGAGFLAARGMHPTTPATVNLASPPSPVLGLTSPPAIPTTAPPTAPAASGIRLVLSASGRSYVTAVVDGRSRLNTFLLAGTTTRLHAAHRIQLVLGAPGVVRVTVNGKVVHPATGTGVGTLTLTWSHGRLHVG